MPIVGKVEEKEDLKNLLKWGKFSFHIMVDREIFTYLKNKFNLTHYVPVFPSYRNQSVDLHSESIDWFLNEGNACT